MEGKEKTTQPQKDNLLIKRWRLLAFFAIAIVALVIVGLKSTIRDEGSASEQEIAEYNEAVRNYNLAAEDYKKVSGLTSLKSADNLPVAGEPRAYWDETSGNQISQNAVVQDTAQIQQETDTLQEALSLAHSVFNQKIEEYNDLVVNYNTALGHYAKIRTIASLKGDENLSATKKPLVYLEADAEVSDFIENASSKDEIIQNSESIIQETEELKEAVANAHIAFNQKISEYNDAAKNYNTVVDEYKRVKTITALDNIDNLPKVGEHQLPLEENTEVAAFLENAVTQDASVQNTELIIQETEELLYALILAQQITNPNGKWVMDRLKSVSGITGVQAVTRNHDPNQLLNVEGGYTSCTYFTVQGISQNSSTSIIDRGTDAGGAVEVYKTVTDAQNRCEYLGQFDNTLLYSGSYAIVGTTVIRTSYLLTNEQQVDLTNKITTAFTELG